MSFLLNTQKLLQLLMRHAEIKGAQTVNRLYSCGEKKKKPKCKKVKRVRPPPGNRPCKPPPPLCPAKKTCKVNPCDPMDQCRIDRLRAKQAKLDAANKKKHQIK